MRNLTTTTLLFTPDESGEGIRLAPAGPIAAECIQERLTLEGERIRAGEGWVDTAREGVPSPAQLDALNRLIEREIAADQAEDGGDGLVIVPRSLLRLIEPELRPRVVAPHPEKRAATAQEDPIPVTMLIRPPKATPDDARTAGQRPPAHRSDDGPRLQVVVERDGDGWAAQAIEVDYAACGNDEADARNRFLIGLEATAKLHLDKHGDLSRLLQPAPTEVWTSLLKPKFDAARRMRIEKEQINMREAGLLFTAISWIIMGRRDA